MTTPITIYSKTTAHQGDDKYISPSEFSRLIQSTSTLNGARRQLATRAALTISTAACLRVSDTVHITLHELHVSPECDASTPISSWQAGTPLLVFGNGTGQGQHR